MHQPDSWHEMLEPPPGGLARLVASVDSRPNKRPGAHWQAYAATASAVVFVLALGIADYAHNALQRRIRQAIESALQAPADNRIEVENGAAIELPSNDSNVRIFRIASLPSKSMARQPPSGAEQSPRRF